MTDYQTKAMITALKDISTQLKTINRNVNYIGRKLEMIDSTLQKHGIAIMPCAEATAEEPEKGYGENITLLSTDEKDEKEEEEEEEEKDKESTDIKNNCTECELNSDPTKECRYQNVTMFGIPICKRFVSDL